MYGRRARGWVPSKKKDQVSQIRSHCHWHINAKKEDALG